VTSRRAHGPPEDLVDDWGRLCVPVVFPPKYDSYALRHEQSELLLRPVLCGARCVGSRRTSCWLHAEVVRPVAGGDGKSRFARKSESLRLNLFEDAFAGEDAEQSVERRFIGTHAASDLGHM
jgi:hypothetical protein